MYVNKLRVTILFFVIIVHLCRISILIIENETIFNDKILAFIAFFIVIYFLNLHLTMYLTYSMLIVTLIKRRQKKEKKKKRA
jgi:membrane protein implicated in regulation of membrane protease activity